MAMEMWRKTFQAAVDSFSERVTVREVASL